MKSPFPGMDPWLENATDFPDFHDSFAYLIKEELNAHLPAGYRANINRLVWVDENRWRKPDVSTFGPAETNPNQWKSISEEYEFAHGGSMVIVDDEPNEADYEEESQQYLEILDTKGNRLVTAIEILSPENKTKGELAHAAYIKKQRQLLNAGVNLVELDFLRSGMHVTAVPLVKLRSRFQQFDYHVCVSLPAEKRKLLAAFTIRDPMPLIIIPLDPAVPSVEINLQQLFDRAYQTGRYGLMINYQRPCDPPLKESDAIWAKEKIEAQTSRA